MAELSEQARALFWDWCVGKRLEVASPNYKAITFFPFKPAKQQGVQDLTTSRAQVLGTLPTAQGRR